MKTAGYIFLLFASVFIRSVNWNLTRVGLKSWKEVASSGQLSHFPLGISEVVTDQLTHCVKTPVSVKRACKFPSTILYCLNDSEFCLLQTPLCTSFHRYLDKWNQQTTIEVKHFHTLVITDKKNYVSFCFKDITNQVLFLMVNGRGRFLLVQISLHPIISSQRQIHF